MFWRVTIPCLYDILITRSVSSSPLSVLSPHDNLHNEHFVLNWKKEHFRWKLLQSITSISSHTLYLVSLSFESINIINSFDSDHSLLLWILKGLHSIHTRAIAQRLYKRFITVVMDVLGLTLCSPHSNVLIRVLIHARECYRSLGFMRFMYELRLRRR